MFYGQHFISGITDMEVVELESFTTWIRALDKTVKVIVASRIGRMRVGNFGDSKSVGGCVSELRINVGPGYRVYFCKKGRSVVVLLAGGDKSTQTADIAKAIQLAAALQAPQQF